MLRLLGHKIPENKPIDFYIWHYPGMVKAYFMCIHEKGDPLGPLDQDIEQHMQLVIKDHNNSFDRVAYIMKHRTHIQG